MLGSAWLVLLSTVAALAQPGNALNFVTNAYVTNSSDLPNYGSNLTVEAWVRTTSVPSSLVVAVSCRDNFYLGIDGSGHPGQVLFNMGGTFLYGQSRVDDGRWHHVAATKAGLVTTVYVDGVAETTASMGNTYYTGQGLTIGAYSYSGSSGWPGSLDEVRIWSTARTAAQIKASFNNALTTPQTGLDVYYSFNQGTAGGNNTGINTLPNLGGLSGFTGTLNGFALNGSTSNWVESYALVLPTGLTATPSSSLAVSWTAPTINGAAPAAGKVEGYVPSGTSTSTLALTASNRYTTIAMNGSTLYASGSGPIGAATTRNLNVGNTTSVVLTSEDGITTATYTVQAVAAPTYFHSAATGNCPPATWQASYNDNTGWVAAPVAPTGSYVGTVNVRNGHVVTVAAATSTKITTIENGGIVNTLVNQPITIPSGATMTVNAGGGVSNQTYAVPNQTLQNLDVNLTQLPAGTATAIQPYLFTTTSTVTGAGILTVRSTGLGTLRIINAPTGSITLGSVDGSGNRSGGYVQQAGTSVR